jgi:lysophospholipase L1-like esterase
MNAITYVAFGDSITVGAKTRVPENRWVSVFARQVEIAGHRPVDIVNAGLGDNTISPRTTNYAHASKPSALERFESDVVSHRPDLVTVAFGLNDMRFGTPASVFAEDLDDMVGRLKVALPAAQLLVLDVFHMTKFNSFPPRDRGSRAATRAYNQAIAAIAHRHDLPLCEVAAALNLRDDLVAEDGVHVADLGHRLIGNRVFETLATATSFLTATR